VGLEDELDRVRALLETVPRDEGAVALLERPRTATVPRQVRQPQPEPPTGHVRRIMSLVLLILILSGLFFAATRGADVLSGI
jgi:hypothetical protein